MNPPSAHPAEPPLILFGAFDRHNLGDLLLGKVAQALMFPRPVVFAGLAARDLTPVGGMRVRSIGELARDWGGRAADIVHVGGEILTCSLYEAAVMLQSDESARLITLRYDADPLARQAWAVRELGLDQAVAYQLPAALFGNCRFVGYLGAGGVGLSALAAEVRDAVVEKLSTADLVWVRDRITHRTLESLGVPSLLAPDPCELVARLFGGEIRERAESEEAASICARYPRGYLAVQFSADYGDDATLDAIGQRLCQIQRKKELGIVFFRAGAAPWHDSLEVYSRLISRMNTLDAAIFDATHILDLCALLARSCGFIGSSLHGRIVTEAFGKMAVSLVRGDPSTSKVGSYIESWHPQLRGTVAHARSFEDAFWMAQGALACDYKQLNFLPDRVWGAANRCRRMLGLVPVETVTSIQT